MSDNYFMRHVWVNESGNMMEEWQMEPKLSREGDMSELDDVIEELEHNEERRLIAESKLSKKIIQCKTLQAERDKLRDVLKEIRGHLLVGNWPSGTTDKYKLHKMATEALKKALEE